MRGGELTDKNQATPGKHGTTTAYRQGCRCGECSAAKSSYDRKDRKHLAGQFVSAIPTANRLEELESEGFTKREIARRIGIRCAKLQRARKRVRKATEDKVKAFYDAVMAEA